MVTGASTAELAVVLVDARNGVVEQTRRHAAVAALLRVPHVVLAVNKMDLVDYAEPVFAADRRGVHRVRRRARRPRGHRDPDLRAGRRQRGRPVRAHGLVRRPDAARAPGDGRRSATTRADAPAALPGAVRDPAADRRAPATTAATPGQIASGTCCGSATRSSVLPSGAHQHGRRHRRRCGDRGGRRAGPAVGDRAARRRPRRLARRPDRAGRRRAAGHPGRARPPSCHLPTGRCAAGDRVLLKHGTRTVKAIVTAIAVPAGPRRPWPQRPEPEAAARSTTSARSRCAPPSRCRSTPTRTRGAPGRSC